MTIAWRVYAVFFQIGAGYTPYFWYREHVKTNHYGYMPDLFSLHPAEVAVLAILVISPVLSVANFILTESERPQQKQ